MQPEDSKTVSGITAVIVGGGAVGVDFHLPRLAGTCGAQAICVVEPDRLRSAQLEARFRGRDNISVVSALAPDTPYALAVVSTPPRFHGEYVERLRDRCAKIIIEKPIARNLAEAQAIVRHLERGTAVGFICHIRRTLSSFRLAKAVIEDGILGELRGVSVHEGSVFTWRAASLGPFSRDLNGGGVLLDTGPHTLDLLFQVFERIDLKQAWMDADLAHGTRAIEANCVLALEADGGVAIELTLSRNRNLSNKACFTFARGTLTLDVRDNTLELAVSDRLRLRGVPDVGSARQMEFKDLFDAYYSQFVVPGDNLGVSPQDSLKGMRVIDAAYRQATPMAGGF